MTFGLTRRYHNLHHQQPRSYLFLAKRRKHPLANVNARQLSQSLYENSSHSYYASSLERTPQSRWRWFSQLSDDIRSSSENIINTHQTRAAHQVRHFQSWQKKKLLLVSFPIDYVALRCAHSMLLLILSIVSQEWSRADSFDIYNLIIMHLNSFCITIIIRLDFCKSH